MYKIPLKYATSLIINWSHRRNRACWLTTSHRRKRREGARHAMALKMMNSSIFRVPDVYIPVVIRAPESVALITDARPKLFPRRKRRKKVHSRKFSRPAVSMTNIFGKQFFSFASHTKYRIRYISIIKRRHGCRESSSLPLGILAPSLFASPLPGLGHRSLCMSRIQTFSENNVDATRFVRSQNDNLDFADRRCTFYYPEQRDIFLARDSIVLRRRIRPWRRCYGRRITRLSTAHFSRSKSNSRDAFGALHLFAALLTRPLCANHATSLRLRYVRNSRDKLCMVSDP